MPNSLGKDLEHHRSLDRRLVDAAKNIKVLSYLNWPYETHDLFLQNWQKRSPVLPKVEWPKTALADEMAELSRIMKACDVSLPIGEFIHQTAHSYLTAARMLEVVGTGAFTELSAEIYGSPIDSVDGTPITNLEAAEHFIHATDEFGILAEGTSNQRLIPPEDVAQRFQSIVSTFFSNHKVEVVLDERLTAKAAAGATKIRLRRNTPFTELDIEQLAQHEAFIHSATMLNGREQPYFKSLGLGAPRTTATQEGLATFAELITNCMDLARLRRIALRIKATHLGLEGGDFIDVFRFFLENDQDPTESFHATARIFRGGDPRGGVVFTKDIVYLKGLLAVTTFLRKAIQMKQYDYCSYLFIGRVTTSDIHKLKDFIESGAIASPLTHTLYVPRWAVNRHCLAAFLCYSTFMSRINLARVRFADILADKTPRST